MTTVLRPSVRTHSYAWLRYRSFISFERISSCRHFHCLETQITHPLIPNVIARVWTRSNCFPNTQSELQSSTMNLQFGGTLTRHQYVSNLMECTAITIQVVWGYLTVSIISTNHSAPSYEPQIKSKDFSLRNRIGYIYTPLSCG
jgi:hypothetical protein